PALLVLTRKLEDECRAEVGTNGVETAVRDVKDSQHTEDEGDTRRDEKQPGREGNAVDQDDQQEIHDNRTLRAPLGLSGTPSAGCKIVRRGAVGRKSDIGFARHALAPGEAADAHSESASFQSTRSSYGAPAV